MTEKAALLAQRLIRNVEQVEMKHDRRPPLYDSVGARLGTGTAADKLGASFDCVAPGMRSCPYHFHYAQEEMFIILEGSGTLRVAGEMLPIVSGDVIFIPPPGIPAPDHQHFRCAAEVPVRQHARTAGAGDVPGFRQIPGDGAQRRRRAGALPAAPFNLARLLAG